MAAISAFLTSGGLVVIGDANQGEGQALADFVSKAFDYQGDWGLCRLVKTNEHEAVGEPQLTEYAASFLRETGNAWPSQLEDAKLLSVSSWCHHDDPSAAILPLYSIEGEETKAAVQAFGKVGVRGAIVWVGYSWRNGEQAQWGSLLRKLIQDFADGAYEAPKQGNAELHPLHVDSVLESAVDLADEAAEVVRRFLQGGSSVAPTYPPPGAQLQRPPSPPRPPLPPPLPGYLRTLARSFVVTITETVTTVDQFNRIIGNITAVIQKATGAETVTIDYIRTALGTIIFSSLNGTVSITGRRRAMAVAPLRVYHDHEVASMFAACEVVPTRMVLEGEEWLSPAEAREAMSVDQDFITPVRRMMADFPEGPYLLGFTLFIQDVSGLPPLPPGATAPPVSPPLDDQYLQSLLNSANISTGNLTVGLDPRPPPSPAPRPPSPTPETAFSGATVPSQPGPLPAKAAQPQAPSAAAAQPAQGAQAVEIKDLRIEFKASSFVQDDGTVDKIALGYAIEDARAKLAAAKGIPIRFVIPIYIRFSDGTLIKPRNVIYLDGIANYGALTIERRRMSEVVGTQARRVLAPTELAQIFAGSRYMPISLTIVASTPATQEDVEMMQEVHAEFYHAVRRFLQMVDADQLEIGMQMQEVHAEFYHAVRRFLQMVDADQLEIGMQILAQGAAGRTRSLVWNTDTDFRQQIAPLAPLQLVDPKKAPCPTTCTACPRTWKGTNTSLSVAIFFKEPVQATAVFIKQIRNPGIIRVQFIKWVYPPKGELGANVGKTVYNVTNDPTVCQSVLSIRIGPVKSGIKLPVPAGGNQDKLPKDLANTAVGGLLITVDRPQRAGPNYGPFLEWVKVSGRVLYPNNATLYNGLR
ncbi:hypothetical protein GPECTOR_4g640 [Gonium pectorale]|uniref:Uncharacterized protein n=1 Tax=Gonium pectorale TaxID=33097 RepID=A0A150GXN7_GONPE|nr:hypothetical protein GPECTOR_4g640 [Gonium pectorale]|eukprot:KXZ54575.1 hypothetical protein GPECTOR_4g640 [Gonium pectorale]